MVVVEGLAGDGGVVEPARLPVKVTGLTAAVEGGEPRPFPVAAPAAEGLVAVAQRPAGIGRVIERPVRGFPVALLAVVIRVAGEAGTVDRVEIEFLDVGARRRGSGGGRSGENS